jgi:threonine/homoserine/homoserine lactone efflux protein
MKGTAAVPRHAAVMTAAMMGLMRLVTIELIVLATSRTFVAVSLTRHIAKVLRVAFGLILVGEGLRIAD